MKTHHRNPSVSLDDFLDKGRRFSSGEGRGVQMKKFKPYADFVLNKLVKNAEIINGEALLPTDGRPVVVVAAHGPGVAWMPLVAMVGQFFIENGYGEIVGGMFPHKAVFLIPGLKEYYRKTLGTPTAVNTVDDIVTLLENNKMGLTGTAPEGANCLFSFDEYVAPFRSKGMIVAAIKADASICLMAHQGAEEWSIRANLPFGWTVPFTNGIRGINIALPPYRKIENYIVLCRRYKPSITSRDLDNKTKWDARALLQIEIAKIRAEMNRMTDEVKALMQQKTGVPGLAEPQRDNLRQGRMRKIQDALFPPDAAYV